MFWRDDVDSILDKLAEDIVDDQFESFGDFNRRCRRSGVEKRDLARHTRASDATE